MAETCSEPHLADLTRKQSAGFAYQPALDGLRAIAVVLVVLFHAGIPAFSGGYVGVSVFFTLSGYLITSLLLNEHDSTGGIAAGAFYSRRMRRLLPASTACIVAIIVARRFGAFDHVPGLRRDVVGALLHSFNWVKLAGHRSYSELFLGGTSPLEHYWSLAIEEQFYWLWPLTLIGLLRLVGRHRVHRVVALLYVLFSILAVLIARWAGPDAAYWATPARLPEILVGAALACLLAQHQVPAWVRRFAPIGLTLVIGAALVLPSGSGPAYQGALPIFALISAALIAALQPDGRLRAALSTPALVAVGKVSYGLYLFHWPVFVLLRERGWDLLEPMRLAVALSITTAITLVSYKLLELPIRRARARPRSTVRMAVAATALTLAAVTFMSPAVSAFDPHPELAREVAIEPSASVAPLPMVTSLADVVPTSSDRSRETQVTVGAVPERPVRIFLFGDSTLQSLTVGLQQWAADNPRLAQVSGVWGPSMEFLETGDIINKRVHDFAADSAQVLQYALYDGIPHLHPDVVVLMTTLADASDRRWSDEEGIIGPTDPRYRLRLVEAYRNLTNQLLAAGIPHVIWVVPPVPLAVPEDDAKVEPTQYRVEQQVIREMIADHVGDGANLVELESWLTMTDHIGRDWRPDGLHITDDKSAELAAAYLGPWLIREAESG